MTLIKILNAVLIFILDSSSVERKKIPGGSIREFSFNLTKLKINILSVKSHTFSPYYSVAIRFFPVG